ncbi:MAG: enoyl-CoA hydratase/isomerase family protein [Robiginitomaculum sp.]|nr:enoyl-CoA hydratase/isomerase family protein [Robiginitomaculum sp.]
MKNLPVCKEIDLELENGWLTVWFNQPEIRNPLSKNRVQGVIDLCAALETRRDIRGVTFRGRGGIFCAGGDLKAFKATFEAAPEERRNIVIELSLLGGKMFNVVNELPQLTIMAVEGAAMAGGFGLVCTGDVVITDAKTRFSLTETMIGLNPAQITPFVYQRLGASNGRRLLMTAATFMGDEAKRLGLADEVCDGSAEMNSAIKAVQKQLFRCAPGAVAATKKLVIAMPNLTKEEQTKEAAESFVVCLLGEEGVEGVSSFLERRKPKWAVSATEMADKKA